MLSAGRLDLSSSAVQFSVSKLALYRALQNASAPALWSGGLHTGIDWVAPEGTPVVAAGNGTVEEAGVKGDYGNYVRIRHVNGYQTAYGHLLKIEPGIDPGISVRQGQTIGQLGRSGLTIGPHLHFEMLL